MLLFAWVFVIPFLMVGFCETWYAALSFTFFIITAFVGAPFFILLLIRNKRQADVF